MTVMKYFQNCLHAALFMHFVRVAVQLIKFTVQCVLCVFHILFLFVILTVETNHVL